ncbi:hypothetical protein BJ912DRAFT_983825, partial [Pholiota molesta]
TTAVQQRRSPAVAPPAVRPRLRRRSATYASAAHELALSWSYPLRRSSSTAGVHCGKDNKARQWARRHGCFGTYQTRSRTSCARIVARSGRTRRGWDAEAKERQSADERASRQTEARTPRRLRGGAILSSPPSSCAAAPAPPIASAFSADAGRHAGRLTQRRPSAVPRDAPSSSIVAGR